MKSLFKIRYIIRFACGLLPFALSGQESRPLRLAVAGLSHGHLAEVVRRIDRGDFVVAGAYEQDAQIREDNGLRGKIDASLFYGDLDEMLDRTKPEAVVAYGSIFDHLRVVEACAPRGIHVMVEKPLAVNGAHAAKMETLARKYNIRVLTNYETSWYDTNHAAYQAVRNGEIGTITRINVYDGHQGPFEIGCGKAFTDWLTDPVLNGGGAVIDFGCYGANLSTWLLNGEQPQSVYGVLNRQKPDKYPKVDDDATIVVKYPSATVQIMVSWNWPMSRKDMHIYGSRGYIYQDTPTRMRVYRDRKETAVTPPGLEPPYNDSFYYLKAVVRNGIQVTPFDPASLENNVLVVRILEAAIQSARTGKAV
ncbi:MAG: Gfo/Idh/MocA family oxidoreductase, partial [Tannerella sp.]|nr:Gfo/Idh/MocA family oxidoreductase [Tannerella sp.]